MSLLRATSRSGLRSTERAPQFGTPIVDIDATDQALAVRLRFSGSPTIRIDGRDVDPESVDAGDDSPRCRLYRTSSGLRGVPERQWVEAALRRRP